MTTIPTMAPTKDMPHPSVQRLADFIASVRGLENAFSPKRRSQISEIIWNASIKKSLCDIAEAPRLCAESGQRYGKFRPYGRKTLFENERLVIVIARWSPKISCAAHNHAGGFGWVCLLNGGVFTETVWHLSGDKIRRKSVSTYEPERQREILTVESTTLHSMSCSTAGTSLHFYRPDEAPKIDQLGMLVADRVTGFVYEMDHDATDGTGGAWLPPDSGAVKRVFSVNPTAVGNILELGSRQFVVEVLPGVVREGWML